MVKVTSSFNFVNYNKDKYFAVSGYAANSYWIWVSLALKYRFVTLNSEEGYISLVSFNTPADFANLVGEKECGKNIRGVMESYCIW